jgi:hypothetical protein
MVFRYMNLHFRLLKARCFQGSKKQQKKRTQSAQVPAHTCRQGTAVIDARRDCGQEGWHCSNCSVSALQFDQAVML